MIKSNNFGILIFGIIFSILSCEKKHSMPSLYVLNPDKSFDINQFDFNSIKRILGVDMPMYYISSNDTVTTICLNEKLNKVTHIYWEINVDIKDSVGLDVFFKKLNSVQTLKVNFNTDGIHQILVINNKTNMIFFGFLHINEKKVKKIELQHLIPY